MRVLITGSTGMVGRNLVDGLSVRNDVELLVPTRAELDLEDRVAVHGYYVDQRPDLVIHAAGLVGGIRANMARPVEFLAVNLRIGVNVIDEARAAGVPALFNLASSCMYPRTGENPLREETILTGELEPTNEGYAIAKVAATRLCAYIRSEYPTLQYKTLIPCNLYGRHDHFDPETGHMIAAVMRRMHEARNRGDEMLTIWGDGTVRREFMYVGDLVDFVVRYIDRVADLPDLMNVGLGHDYSVNEYYHALRTVVGYAGTFVHDTSKPVGMKQKLVDTRRQAELGWSPPTSLEVGLAETYRFFLENEVGR